jgi:hypothetical protein
MGITPNKLIDWAATELALSLSLITPNKLIDTGNRRQKKGSLFRHKKKAESANPPHTHALVIYGFTVLALFKFSFSGCNSTLLKATTLLLFSLQLAIKSLKKRQNPVQSAEAALAATSQGI